MDQNQDEPKSLLSNLRPHHVVEIYNPLVSSDKLKGDFTWQVARSVVQDDPAFRDPHIKNMNLRNDSHPTMKHVTQTITIPSGTSMNLPGDVAQVIVEHLVDEIMYRQGNKATISDPVQRHAIESKVIKNIDDLRDQLSSQNIEEQLEQQIRNLNKGDLPERTQDAEETPFPGLESASQPEAAPAPGTGVSFTPSQKAAAAK